MGKAVAAFIGVVAVSLFILTGKEDVSKQNTTDRLPTESKTKILVGGMDPLPDELLQEPILLESCPELRIIEWRSSSEFKKETTLTSDSLNTLNQTCKKAIIAFPEFIRSREKSLAVTEPFTWDVCFMPGSSMMGGRDPRNLNDSMGRFSLRVKQPEGIIYSGYTAHQRRKIFIRNDIHNDDGTVNQKVITVFAHEIFHAMSWHYKLGTSSEEDEKLAVDFTTYLGF